MGCNIRMNKSIWKLELEVVIIKMATEIILFFPLVRVGQ